MRPESPHIAVIPGTHISVTFDHYGMTLVPESVVSCLFEARFIAGEKIITYGPWGHVHGLQPWGDGNVWMGVTPEERGLLWFDLATAIEGMMEFVAKFGTFEFNFEIRHQGRPVGKGFIRKQL